MQQEFNWKDCVSKFSREQIRELAAERAVGELTIEGLCARYLIGLYAVPKWDNAECISFPIRNKDGTVFRAHCRSPQRNLGGKWDWRCEPWDKENRPIPALVFGNPDTANKLLIFESQWDGISAIDKLNLFPEIDSGQTCLFMTRGAEFGTRLGAFNWDGDGRTVYAFPQNDPAGSLWLGNVLTVTCGKALIVRVPPEHKDLGEWVKTGGATPYDIEGAIDHAHPEPAPKDGEQPPPLRPMPSWIAYGELEVDRTQYHIGEGFLEIGGFIMLIGASYVGKSTLVTQLSICLAISQAWLFFNVERALRVLVVQAEDPMNKLIKMGQMHKRMGLSPEQIQLVKKNTAVLTIRDLQDSGALAEIERHVLVFKPDIIILNPLTSYLSGSIYKDEVINRFLRIDLTQMLDRLHLSAIVVHHPPKPLTTDKEPKDLTAFELQYGGAGMAALANAPRGNMFLVHVDGDVFKLTVGKGFEDLGTSETAVYLRRSKDAAGIMLWERCEQNQAEEAAEKLVQRKAKKQSTKFVPYDRLLKLLRPTEKYSPLQVRQIVKERLNRGENFTKDALKELVREKRLALTREKNPNGGPFVFYHLPTLLEPADNNPDPEDIP